MSAIGTSEYMKIRRYVMNLILRAGKDPVQIPTINELSEKFGVSRPTVSKAMKELTSEGYIIGRRGIGSFTNPAKISPSSFGRQLPLIGISLGNGLMVHLDKYYGNILAELLKKIVAMPAIVHLVSTGSSDKKQIICDIMNEQLDALVVVDGNSFVSDLRKKGLKVVTTTETHRLTPGSVSPDYDAWGYLCEKQLLKENRRNIVFLHDEKPWNAAYDGFRRAFREAGTPLNEKFFLKDYRTSLTELKNMVHYGVRIDAVVDTLWVNNEVADILMEENPELAKTCALVHNLSSEPQTAGFHEICYEIPFEKIAEETLKLLLLQFSGDNTGMDIRKIPMEMIIR